MTSTQPNPPVEQASLEDVRGLFPNEDTMSEAVSRLTRAGVDQSRMTLPHVAPGSMKQAQQAAVANPGTEEQTRQLRTLESSSAGAAAAMAGAAAVIATGGAAAVALAAAAGAGVMVGGGVFAARSAAEKANETSYKNESGDGQLVLSVAIGNDDTGWVEREMRAAGATDVRTIRPAGAGISGQVAL